MLLSTILSLLAGQLAFGVGGALWVVLAMLIVKAIFKGRNREKFETFKADVEDALNRRQDASSIF